MKIIAAVSGGVDSVVMLHVLLEQYNTSQLIVAHVDHGYRQDSAADARFVEALSQQYSCQFVSTRLDLPDTSEATAREHRWRFLQKAAQEHGADRIATAHHRDDVYETMLLNIARGTGRHGLTSLQETEEVMRPLLSWSKEEIYQYALEYRLEWVEDPTNVQDEYARNQLRHSGALQRLGVQLQLERLYKKLMDINAKLDVTLTAIAKNFTQKTEADECRVDRSVYNQLSFKVQLEIARYLLTEFSGKPPRDSLQVERCAIGIKVGLPYTKTNIGKGVVVRHEKQWSYIQLI